jgi:hypothetical protein
MAWLNKDLIICSNIFLRQAVICEEGHCQDDPELWKQTPTYTEYGDTVKIYRDGKLIMELTPEKDEESKEEYVKYERTAK